MAHMKLAAGAHGIHAHLCSERPKEDQFRERSQGHQDIDVVHGNLQQWNKRNVGTSWGEKSMVLGDTNMQKHI